MDVAKIEHMFTYQPPSDRAIKLIEHSRSHLKLIAIELTNELGESADLTVAIRKLHDASISINYAILSALPKE